MEKHGRTRQATDENIIWRMRFTCWIKKATDLHSECVILIVFPWQQYLQESTLRLYAHCLVIIKRCVMYSKHCALKGCTERYHYFRQSFRQMEGQGTTSEEDTKISCNNQISHS
jgi:hypothetical protein